MFENPRRGRQARNFYNKCSENSKTQIVFPTDIFRKLTLGAPDVGTAGKVDPGDRVTLPVEILFVDPVYL